MPAYFKFLTILFFHIVLQEQVDVVILEVGIGGELDCTNVIRNTELVGLTSLGLEHTQLLGDTLEEIAWQKAGIIKPQSKVFTSANQQECLQVIRTRIKERKAASFCIVPEFEKYLKELPNDKRVNLLKLNDVTRLNGSLAIQLAHAWLRKHGHKAGDIYYELNGTKLSQETLNGIENCSWPGRCQLVKLGKYK